jgi:hypothetical protein
MEPRGAHRSLERLGYKPPAVLCSQFRPSKCPSWGSRWLHWGVYRLQSASTLGQVDSPASPKPTEPLAGDITNDLEAVQRFAVTQQSANHCQDGISDFQSIATRAFQLRLGKGSHHFNGSAVARQQSLRSVTRHLLMSRASHSDPTSKQNRVRGRLGTSSSWVHSFVVFAVFYLSLHGLLR